MTTQVVHVRLFGNAPALRKAMRENPDIVYLGRRNNRFGLQQHPLANPYMIGKDGDRDMVLFQYRCHLLANPELLDLARAQKGKTLVCWCAPERCHCDLVAQIADSLFPPRLCVCGCWGFDHVERWDGDTFKGTRCVSEGHAGHKFQIAIPTPTTTPGD